MFSFGKFDNEIKIIAKNNKLKTYSCDYIYDGWFVLNKKEIAKEIKKLSITNNIDLVVLTWEIWDLAVEIYKILKNTNIKFIVVMHSIPFATCLMKTNSYLYDCFKKFLLEKRWMIKKYMLLRNYQAYIYIPKNNILTMTKTVEKKFKKYFPKKELLLSYPGYCVEIPKKIKIEKYEYDFVYMAKFEYGKGIFKFIDIANRIIKKNKNVKFALIGDFTFKDEEFKFIKLLKKKNLENNISLLGWKNNKEKYEIIQKSKIFLYPSFIGDTFSQSLLEALSCGKKIICYDVPFSRDNFPISTVVKIKPFNNEEFSLIALESLTESNFYYKESVNFVKKYYNSWENVAKAEYNCYKEVLYDNNIYSITKNGLIEIDKNKILKKTINNKEEFNNLRDNYKYFKNSKYVYKIYEFNENFTLKMELVNGDLLKDRFINVDDRISFMKDLFYNWLNYIKSIKNINYNKCDNFNKKVNIQINLLNSFKLKKDYEDLLYFYKLYFEKIKTFDDKFILHGDINLNNIFCINNSFKLIDMSPVIGCLELELVKYIEDELFLEIEKFEYIINLVIKEFSKLNINIEKMLKILFVDSCYRTFNSFLENDAEQDIEKGIILNKKIIEYIGEIYGY